MKRIIYFECERIKFLKSSGVFLAFYQQRKLTKLASLIEVLGDSK
jgi:hypothetical protein